MFPLLAGICSAGVCGLYGSAGSAEEGLPVGVLLPRQCFCRTDLASGSHVGRPVHDRVGHRLLGDEPGRRDLGLRLQLPLRLAVYEPRRQLGDVPAVCVLCDHVRADGGHAALWIPPRRSLHKEREQRSLRWQPQN